MRVSSGGCGTRSCATVIDIGGDGSFSMTMNEVITAVCYRLPGKAFWRDDRRI